MFGKNNIVLILKLCISVFSKKNSSQKQMWTFGCHIRVPQVDRSKESNLILINKFFLLKLCVKLSIHLTNLNI